MFFKQLLKLPVASFTSENTNFELGNFNPPLFFIIKLNISPSP